MSLEGKIVAVKKKKKTLKKHGEEVKKMVREPVKIKKRGKIKYGKPVPIKKKKG